MLIAVRNRELGFLYLHYSPRFEAHRVFPKSERARVHTDRNENIVGIGKGFRESDAKGALS